MPRFIGYALALFIVIPLTLTTSTAQSNKTKLVRDPGSVMPENKVPGTIESTARRLTHQLEAQGYAVARGYAKLYTEADCDCVLRDHAHLLLQQPGRPVRHARPPDLAGRVAGSCARQRRVRAHA